MLGRMTYVARFALCSFVAVMAACGSVSTGPDAGGAIDAAIDGPADAPTDATPTATLQVALGGNGTGTITSTPAGINCGADCSEAYPVGTTVVLSAVAVAAAVMVRLQGPVPVHAPDQPLKVEPAAAVAVSVTAVP